MPLKTTIAAAAAEKAEKLSVTLTMPRRSARRERAAASDFTWMEKAQERNKTCDQASAAGF